MKRRMLGAITAIAIAGSAGACGGSDGGTGASAASDGALNLEIGFSGAREGPYAAYDEPLLNGMRFAADEINAADGPVNVEIDFRDNRGDQQEASTTMQALLDDGIGVFVLTNGDALVAQGALGSAAGAVMTLGASTAPKWVNDIGENAFLLAFGDNVQTAAIAQKACDEGYRTAWTLGSNELPFLSETPGYFKAAFEEICGGKVVGEDQFKAGQTEFNTQVTKIRNASPAPDVIFTPMFVPDSGVFLKALRGAGVDLPFLGLDGDDSPLFAKSGGRSVDGTVFSTHGFPEPGSDMAAFYDAFEKKTGDRPESVFEALGRDHVYALVDAVERMKSVEPSKVAEGLRTIKDLPLLTGTTSMDPDTRVPVKEITLVEMRGTKPSLLELVTPKFVPQP